MANGAVSQMSGISHPQVDRRCGGRCRGVGNMPLRIVNPSCAVSLVRSEFVPTLPVSGRVAAAAAERGSSPTVDGLRLPLQPHCADRAIAEVTHDDLLRVVGEEVEGVVGEPGVVAGGEDDALGGSLHAHG